MNIFFLDYNEKLCASYHCDKHVNKMIVEHLQMISVALAHYGYEPARKKDGTCYSTKAYKNHPCTLWVKESNEDKYPKLGLTPPALCMPDKYKHEYGPVISYRAFYNHDKKEFASWNKANNNVPSWWAPACSIDSNV